MSFKGYSYHFPRVYEYHAAPNTASACVSENLPSSFRKLIWRLAKNLSQLKNWTVDPRYCVVWRR